MVAAPVGIVADGAGNVYTAEAESGYVNKFSLDGEPRLSFQDDRLNLRPTSIAVDDGGAIYVTDGRRGSVVAYFPDGRRYRELRIATAAGVRGSLRLVVDANGIIYVAGKRPFGVRKYSLRGRLLGAWGSPASREAVVEDPAGLAAGADGLIYMSEAEVAIIRVYQRNGILLRTLTVPEEAAQFAGIAANGGFVFAADPRNHALHVWSKDGSYRLRQDLSPWISGNWPSPLAVAVTRAGDCLVLDAAGGRVLRFRLHL